MHSFQDDRAFMRDGIPRFSSHQLVFGSQRNFVNVSPHIVFLLDSRTFMCHRCIKIQSGFEGCTQGCSCMPFKPVSPRPTQTSPPDPDGCGRAETIHRRTRNEQVKGSIPLGGSAALIWVNSPGQSLLWA
jgi:hypothetical protein